MMQTGTDKLVFLGRLAGGVAIMVAVAWIVGLVRELSAAGYGGHALDVDFAVFWGAAKLTLAEGPLTPFDIDKLNASRALPADLQTFPMLWLYPPGWLAAILPLGLLPFAWAWAVFAGASFAIFATALRLPARAVPGLWPLMLAAPAILLTLALGQTSLIFAGLLVLAREAIRREKAVLAGLAIAAMTLKPQLGLAIPVALLAAGQWRVILWAAMGTAAILAASLIWPGADYWPLFFTATQESVAHMRASLLPAMMVTGYGLATTLGLDHGPALAIQIVLSLAAAGGLGWMWASRASFDLKAAALALAVLLVTQALAVEAPWQRLADATDLAAEDSPGARRAALSALKELVLDEPGLHAAHYNLGSTYEKLEDVERAYHHYQTAANHKGRAADAALSNLARLDILAGNSATAIERLLPRINQVKDASVKSSVHKNLGWAYLLQKHYSDAQYHLQKAIELDSERAASYCLLAQVQDIQGDEESALASWANCLTYDTRNKRRKEVAWRSPELDFWQFQARERLKPSGN